MFKVIKYLFIFLLFALPMGTLYVVVNAVSDTPLVAAKSASPKQVNNAVLQYKRISYQVFGPSPKVRIILTKRGVEDVMTAASHLLPRTNFESQVEGREASLNGSLDIRNQWFDGYLNVSCNLVSGRESGAIESCQLGNMSIPGFLVQQTIDSSLQLFFDNSVKNTVNQLINNVQIHNQLVLLTATKSPNFKARIQSGLKNVASAVKTISEPEVQVYEPELINTYLEYLADIKWSSAERNASLSIVLSRAFQLAQIRSEASDPRTENEAALWAVAIAYANHRFAEVIKADTPEVIQTLKKMPKKVTTLGKRADLSLHFLYSAVMERLGNSALSVQVGELKELYDANPKGSGFDFSDLMADKAGAEFSRYLSSSVKAAKQGQDLLAASRGESVFFPALSELPKPVKGKAFDKAIGSTETQRYQQQIEELDKRIRNLPLYQN
ncbi:hypothetical protein [Vibrio sp. HN007]|uniref:hypothetical protein n=1 Tax=Vibrio iocasae TaxID=3098914 RepID=UPI0035D42A47